MGDRPGSPAPRPARARRRRFVAAESGAEPERQGKKGPGAPPSSRLPSLKAPGSGLNFTWPSQSLTVGRAGTGRAAAPAPLQLGMS